MTICTPISHDTKTTASRRLQSWQSLSPRECPVFRVDERLVRKNLQACSRNKITSGSIMVMTFRRVLRAFRRVFRVFRRVLMASKIWGSKCWWLGSGREESNLITSRRRRAGVPISALTVFFTPFQLYASDSACPAFCRDIY